MISDIIVSRNVFIVATTIICYSKISILFFFYILHHRDIAFFLTSYPVTENEFGHTGLWSLREVFQWWNFGPFLVLVGSVWFYSPAGMHCNVSRNWACRCNCIFLGVKHYAYISIAYRKWAWSRNCNAIFQKVNFWLQVKLDIGESEQGWCIFWWVITVSYAC